MNFKSIRCAVVLSFMLVCGAPAFSQTAGPAARYSATTTNTSSSGDTIRFDILRWSTDAERDQLVTALEGSGDAGLLGALQKAPTIGYIWTNETAGYPLRYAYRATLADGGERLILAIDRPLGSYEPQRWKLSGTAASTSYPYTVVELHISKAGPGDGKASLNSKVIADKSAKTIALESYAAAPVLFQGVKK
jgi:hypothetical protein